MTRNGQNFTKYFAANFERFGLRKLISTSYAKSAGNREATEFEKDSPLYDPERHERCGKVFVLDGDTDGSGLVDTDDIRFQGYLEGDGDFRSDEVTRLRDEADFVISNGPFSLFRSFLKWIMDGKKRFIIIGNMNAITYKEVFPLLKDNEIWLGTSHPKEFIIMDNSNGRENVETRNDGIMIAKFGNICWYTNVDFARRHEPLMLDTMAHNLKFNKKLKRKLESAYGNATQYPHYDNYDAIEVPLTECIPSDYDAGMGVPITFLDKWNPEQFEIVGADFELAEPEPLPDGKTGTGRFYVRTRESTALVLALGHTKEELMRSLGTMGVPEDEMQWCSGIMGVPITFMDKYNPERFEIIGGFNGHSCPDDDGGYVHSTQTAYFDSKGRTKIWNGPTVNRKTTYYRVLIRAKRPSVLKES